MRKNVELIKLPGVVTTAFALLSAVYPSNLESFDTDNILITEEVAHKLANLPRCSTPVS